MFADEGFGILLCDVKLVVPGLPVIGLTKEDDLPVDELNAWGG